MQADLRLHCVPMHCLMCMRYGNCSNCLNTFLFLFSSKILVIRAGIHKILVRIENRGDPDRTVLLQKQSDLNLCCLSRYFDS